MTKLPAAIITIIPSSVEQRQHERLAAEEPARREVAARIEQRRATRRRRCKNLSMSDSMSSTTMPVDGVAPARSRRSASDDPRGDGQRDLRQPEATSGAARVRQEEVEQQDRARAAEHDDLGQDGEEIERRSSAAAVASQLAPRTCASRSVDRRVHHVDERLRPHAHPQHERGDRAEQPELAAIEVRRARATWSLATAP